MTIRCILAGRIHRPAEQKTSHTGKPYVTGSIAVDGQPEGQPRYARITAFGDEADALLQMGKGAAIAVSGRMEASVWAPEGKPAEVQVRLIVDAVLTIAPTGRKPMGNGAVAAQEARHDDADGWMR